MRRILVLPSGLLDDVAASFLERRSFKVRTAANIEEAMGMTSVWPPELIIFGDNLEDGTPQSLCDHVRADRRLAPTRLLLISSFLPGDDIGAEVLHAAVDAHLVQPVEPEVLLRSIGVLLDIQVRRSRRLPLELLAKVQLEARASSAERTMWANVLGVSETGALLECEKRLATGDVVGVTFALPDTGKQITVRCMVLSSDELQLHYGCEFLDCDAETKIAIRQFVRETLGPEESELDWRR